MSLEQRIQEERNRISGEVKLLTEENIVDVESLDVLKQSYNSAIISSDEKEIDRVNAQIKEVNGRITRRKEKIEAYGDKNNPIIQAMICEEATGWLNELAILEEQAVDKDKELTPVKAELIEGLLEMDGMKRRSVWLRSTLNDWKEQLSEHNRDKIGLPVSRFDLLSPVTTRMRMLLVERKDAGV
ncbi:hypothetical protein [Sporosarcina limicola]|uniref:Uncharacterized protein n=1 Tax=Sporosarcina limicola TaxID=34101 RepID=A0A927MN12_9BACL|nr:hypothetical protein [Sporosarcina limicola]MBE1557001.1 hypothetical protein [Sporosarcina limicola]